MITREERKMEYMKFVNNKLIKLENRVTLLTEMRDDFDEYMNYVGLNGEEYDPEDYYRMQKDNLREDMKRWKEKNKMDKWTLKQMQKMEE